MALSEARRDGEFDRRTALGLAAKAAIAFTAFAGGTTALRPVRAAADAGDEADLAFAPATELARRVASKQISATELATLFLSRIDRLGPALNAFTTVMHEQALTQATDDVINRVMPFIDTADVLITPTTPGPAWEAGQLTGMDFHGAALKSLPAASWTTIWNVCGNPAAAIPTGFSASGLPLSAQLIGPPDSELRLTSLAAQIEQAQPWSGRRPRIS
ncbi:amidase family protein [Nocardia sp. NBC_01388]|uniref:amidase family protein n=1 Tax=Nocardia sp. NBC_01388 TaxID=2903596 RepID=UPI0032455B2F